MDIFVPADGNCSSQDGDEPVCGGESMDVFVPASGNSAQQESDPPLEGSKYKWKAFVPGGGWIMSRLMLKITGRVQGVGFRWFVLRAAQPLGLTGLARNCPDGSVEVIAEGSTEALARLESACREGPRSAHVERVDRRMDSAATGQFKTFEIG